MAARPVLCLLLLLCAVAMPQGAPQDSDAPDPAMYGRIRDEGQTRSRIMRYATELVDGIGARLTGSPNLAEAVTWAQERLNEIGLTRVRTEDWGEFGLGCLQNVSTTAVERRGLGWTAVNELEGRNPL